jgi:hypothetical protein
MLVLICVEPYETLEKCVHVRARIERTLTFAERFPTSNTSPPQHYIIHKDGVDWIRIA